MPELIDKKRTEAKVFLIARLFIDLPDREVELVKAVIRRCCEEIDKQPTIEPKRGRWDEIQCFSEHGVEMASYECTSCGNDIERQRGVLPQYCEFCGAKMDLRTPTEAALDMADSVMMGGADNGRCN